MKRDPAQVFSLAEFIAEEMDARGWTSETVASMMPGDYATNALTIDLLLAIQGDPAEQVKIDAAFCSPLETAFGVSDGFFLRLNDGWDAYPDRRSAYTAPEHLFSGGRLTGGSNG